VHLRGHQGWPSFRCATASVIAVANTPPMITSLTKWWFIRMRVLATTTPITYNGIRNRGKEIDRLKATATTVAVCPDGNEF